MNLDRIEISNFRSISDLTLRFESRLRILVGKNESGKSNILRACSLLDPSVPVSAQDLRESKDGEDPVQSGQVRFVFRLNSEELRAAHDAISAEVLGPLDDFCDGRSGVMSFAQVIQTLSEWLWVVDIPDGERRPSRWRPSGMDTKQRWLKPRSGPDSTQALNFVRGADQLTTAPALIRTTLVEEQDRSSFVLATIRKLPRQVDTSERERLAD